jgi:plastocyanin
MTRFIPLIALFAATPASAGDLTLRVLDTAGRPVENAVVSMSNGSPPSARASGRYVMAQQGMAFRPFLLVVPVGAKVAFPNLDPTRHHVYSFSPTKKFELKLFAKDQSRSVTFDRPGVVALGCNIHDAMSAFIYVTANDWTAKTDARGVAVISGAPPSGGMLTVWHPYLRSPQGTMQLTIRPGQHAANVAIRLRPPPMRMDNGY